MSVEFLIDTFFSAIYKMWTDRYLKDAVPGLFLLFQKILDVAPPSAPLPLVAPPSASLLAVLPSVYATFYNLMGERLCSVRVLEPGIPEVRLQLRTGLALLKKEILPYLGPLCQADRFKDLLLDYSYIILNEDYHRIREMQDRDLPLCWYLLMTRIYPEWSANYMYHINEIMLYNQIMEKWNLPKVEMASTPAEVYYQPCYQSGTIPREEMIQGIGFLNYCWKLYQEVERF